MPAAIIDPSGQSDLTPPLAHSVLQCEVDEAGKITTIYVVNATRNLAGMSRELS